MTQTTDSRRIMSMSLGEIMATARCSRDEARAMWERAQRAEQVESDATWRAAGAVPLEQWLADRRAGRA